jgi:ATP-dependent DNA helicase RecG
MELMTGPTENRMIKNVAAMMFCEHPEKFFPYTQVEIVSFPEGREKNPQNFTEKTFKGSVPQIIKQTMDYLETNVLFETVQKVSGKQEANRFWNYPYDAIEEAVVNSLYHRDYQQYEPVEITIEPDEITILNCPGPDRSISMSAIELGDSLKSRRYRNRRLGDFLKELDLTEGRSTGIPTIQEKLAENGSPRATFETTEDRLTFLIHIPVHSGCGSKPVTETNEENSPVTAKTATVSTTETTTKTATETTAEKIIRLMRENPRITNKELASACGITEDGVYWNTKKLRKNNIIRRVGGDFGGHWEVLEATSASPSEDF